MRVTALALASALAAVGSNAAPDAPKVIADIDLASAFRARSDWRFIARQGPEIDDPVYGAPDKAPGVISICLARGDPGACDTPLAAMFQTEDGAPFFSDAHYLNQSRIVYPQSRSSPPLLWVQTATIHAGNGSQGVFTQVFAYRMSADRFERIYAYGTGTNENQEVRFVASGPLKGSIISAEPTDDAPYGYWITVSRLAPTYQYKQALRYRSATHYNDGNGLAAIDSEMANIEQRLGLWRVGQPLPLPAKCPKPKLIKKELWCGPPPARQP